MATMMTLWKGMCTMTTLRKFVDRVVYEPNFFMKVRIASYVVTILILLGAIL